MTTVFNAAGFLDAMRGLAETPLSTERLVLEPLHPRHAAALLEGLQAAALYQFIPQEPPADLAWLTARFERLAGRGPVDRSAVWLNWAIRRRDGGYCGRLEATATPDGAVDIAYMVFIPQQRQGIALEATRALIAACWQRAETQRIGASLDTRNGASAALLDRMGFVRVALLPDADFFKGTTSHEHRYELVR